MIFERLGIKVDARFVPHPVAMAEIANSDKYAAVVFVSSKPLDPFIKRKWPEGYRFSPSRSPRNSKNTTYRLSSSPTIIRGSYLKDKSSRRSPYHLF